MTSGKTAVDALLRDRPSTVLLVDDEADICESLKDYLEKMLPGVRVLTATSGAEALRLLQGQSVDLIITDYRMPGMDGLTFLDEASKVAPKVPRMMITAYPDLELALKAVNEHNVQKFVTKPVQPEIADYVRVALMDQRQKEMWERSFAMKLPGKGPP
jgi:CheY-like chemotaxis protein